MKKGFFLSTIALLSLGVLAGCGGGGGQSTPSQSGSSSGGEETLNIGEVKVWCDQKVLDLTESQIKKFMAAHPTYNMTYKIEPKGEGGAAGDMVQDPTSGADIYFFAQDQLSRLVTAKAIATVPTAYVNEVKSANDAGSVKAASVADTLYAYPASSDNTFFMYYNKEVMGNTDMTDFNAIVAKAKEAGKKVYMDIENAWYNSSFFYGAGAHSEWTSAKDGSFTEYDDTYNSAAGEVAVKGMRTLFSDKTVFVNGSAAGEAFNSGAAVVISGIWDKNDVKDALGDKMGAAVLPNYKVDGKSYPLTPFGGFKLVGTKPQTVVDRSKGVAQLAIYLTNTESQLGRFEGNGWGPSNVAAQKDPKVAADEVLKVVFAQMATATPQGQYPGDWWNYEKTIGTEAIGTKDIKSILQSYEDGLDDFIS
jgi:arabinogalactan oligomer/maltooligosaccharide transport system substrate-binding protein